MNNRLKLPPWRGNSLPGLLQAAYASYYLCLWLCYVVKVERHLCSEMKGYAVLSTPVHCSSPQENTFKPRRDKSHAPTVLSSVDLKSAIEFLLV